MVHISLYISVRYSYNWYLQQARDLHNAVAYKQARQKKKNKEDAVKVGSGVAIGIGILTGAVLVAKALGGGKR